MNATVACRHCGTPTPMLGTRECDRCHELWTRIDRDPGLARKALAEHDARLAEAVVVRKTPHQGDVLGRCFECMWSGRLTCPHVGVAEAPEPNTRNPSWYDHDVTIDGVLYHVSGREPDGPCGVTVPDAWHPMSEAPQKPGRYVVAHRGATGGDAYFNAPGKPGWSQMPDWRPTHWCEAPGHRTKPQETP